MLIGYARVSTQDQDAGAQVAALEAAGCERIQQEQATGVRERPELDELLRHLRPGDVVCVWALDRLGRSLADLVSLLDQIARTGAGFRSLREGIDTSTASGRLYAHVIGAMAEFEHARMQERTLAGMEQARRKGRRSGRKPKLSEVERRAVVQMVRSGEKTAADAARLLGVHRSTVGRLVAQEEALRTDADEP